MDLSAIGTEYVFAIFAVLLILGIFSSKLSTWVKSPALLMFLAVGVLAGTEGIGQFSFVKWNGIEFADYGVANFVGSMALCYILFSGGLDTDWKSIKRVAIPGGLLASLGVFLTAIIVGFFAHWVFKMPLEYCILLGAIISSTDAAAVFGILRSKSVGLKGDMQPLLEFESGSNDPMAAFLTLFMIGMIKDSGSSYWVILPSFLIKMSLGIGFGALVAFLVGKVINKIELEYDGLYFVLGIGIVLLTYGLCEIVGGNGFMAVYVCGLVMGNLKFLFKTTFKRFHDSISWLMQVVMFLMLGILVKPSALMNIAWQGIALAFCLMFIARPLSVWACLPGKRFSNREKILISWGGIRGAAPIVLATFPAIQGVQGAEEYFALVFFIVLISVLLQGKTLMPVARALKLDKPIADKVRSPLIFEETGIFGSEMYEFLLMEDSYAVDKRVMELKLPKESRILLIRRGKGFMVPEGNTKLKLHDELLFLTVPTELDTTINLLAKGPILVALDNEKEEVFFQGLT